MAGSHQASVPTHLEPEPRDIRFALGRAGSFSLYAEKGHPREDWSTATYSSVSFT